MTTSFPSATDPPRFVFDSDKNVWYDYGYKNEYGGKRKEELRK